MRKKLLLAFAFVGWCFSVMGQHQEMKAIDPKQFKLLPQSAKFKSADGVLMSMFDETGQKLLVGGLEKRIVCYDLSSGEEVWKVAGTNIEVASSADMYTLDVPFLAVGNNMFSGGEVHVYHWESGELLGTLSPFARGMHSMTYSPSGNIFWFGPGGGLFGYSIVNNSFVTPTSGLEGHANDGNSVRIGPFENVYSVGVDGQFIKWKGRFDESSQMVLFEGGSEVMFKADKPLMSLALNKYIKNSDDSKAAAIYAAIGENKGLVRVFKMNGGSSSVLQTFQVPDGYCGNLNFHPTDPRILVITGKQQVVFYDFKTNFVLLELTMPSEIRSFDMSIDGTKWAVGLASGEVRVYSL